MAEQEVPAEHKHHDYECDDFKPDFKAVEVREEDIQNEIVVDEEGDN